MPPGLHRKSLIVVTPGRDIQFTAPTGQRHETWYMVCQPPCSIGHHSHVLTARTRRYRIYSLARWRKKAGMKWKRPKIQPIIRVLQRDIPALEQLHHCLHTTIGQIARPHLYVMLQVCHIGDHLRLPTQTQGQCLD